MTSSKRFLHGALAIVLVTTAACSDDPTSPATDAPGMGSDAPPTTTPKYRQVEHLARPGINEALLISEGFLAGYNATAPSFAGVDPAVLNMVVDQAKTVLKALYLGACLVNGVLPTGTTPLKPGGLTCHAIGFALFVGGQENGTVLTDASKTNSQAYADAVFGYFIPDVMRVDTSVASGYASVPCNGGPMLLCGGRLLNEDAIDITYNLLLNGGATTKGVFDATRAVTGDGVNFSLDDTKNSGSVTPPVPASQNPQVGHPDISDTFPYSAAPF